MFYLIFIYNVYLHSYLVNNVKYVALPILYHGKSGYMGKQPQTPFYLCLAISFVRKNNEFKTILYF